MGGQLEQVRFGVCNERNSSMALGLRCLCSDGTERLFENEIDSELLTLAFVRGVAYANQEGCLPRCSLNNVVQSQFPMFQHAAMHTTMHRYHVYMHSLNHSVDDNL
jgi:hypothetical protein